MELLFTRGCHHKHLTVIFLTQNLFYQGRCSRTCSLNTHYLVLLKSPRQGNQLLHLGRQLYPSKAGVLVQAYNDSTKSDYGYLVVDSTPKGDDKYRLRTHIFPGEDPIVYIPTV